MKLPSLDSLINKSTATLKRFPIAIFFAFAGAGFLMLLLHLPYQLLESHHYYWNITMSCYLGLLLFIALPVFSERALLSKTSNVFLQMGGLVLIFTNYFFLPDHFMIISVIRFTLFSIGLHLLISFVPFIKSGELNGFWQYNKIIFLRILTSALYSGVLYVGLALAILAINELFKADINGKVYGDLWIFLAAVFNTWFFLAGFPSEMKELESRTDYPKGLKIFTQYVLLPLITVYLLILYAYMFKIIFSVQWPVGWVSYLVLGFSIAGILSLLLIHPIRNDEENKWMLVFSRFFYFAIFPLIILLFLAIKRRISDYGITENRYFILVLALWLVFIAGYFLISKTKNIKLIPLSLCMITFLTSFGPWGAFHVSLKSQQNHLTTLLEKNKLLVAGKVKKSEVKISFNDHKEISSVIEYIAEVHGYEKLQPYFVQNLDSLMAIDSTILKNRNTYEQSNKILALMNISYVNSYQTNVTEEESVDYRSETTASFDIKGYDYFISDFRVYKDDVKDTLCSSYRFGNTVISVCFDFKSNWLSISDKSDSLLTFDVSLLIDSIKAKNYVNDNIVKTEDMTMTSGADGFSAKVLFGSIYADRKHDTLSVRHLIADIMIKFGKEKENEVGERNQ